MDDRTTRILKIEIDINNLCPDKEWTQEHLKKEITKVFALWPLYTNAIRFEVEELRIEEKEDLPYGKDAMCICADCSEIVPMWVECESTRQPDHDGIWADCPECGITGVEA